MKQYLLLIACALLIASCSSPKYAYHFDYYDYNSGKKAIAAETAQSPNGFTTPETSPLKLDEQAVTASAEDKIQPVETSPVVSADLAEQKAQFEKKYSSLSKAEKKEFRKEVKSVVKKAIKAKKEGKGIESIEETKAMDHDLKMALIFGVIAIVLGALSGAGSVFWVLSIISLVVAVVFFIQWIARQ